MNTEIINVENLHEYAKSKGYKSPYYIPVNSYMQLYLMQNWLIDRYKIFVEVVLMQPLKYAYEVYNTESMEILAGYITYSDSYDFALLQGINEALQLI